MKTPERLILEARVHLLMGCPFFGQLAMQLVPVDASRWMPTMGTDGKHFYYNEKFLRSLTMRELEFCFGHEVLHCVYIHVGEFSRRGTRNAKLWNYAGDFVINLDLQRQKVGDIPKIRILLDEQFDGMIAEEVYDILYKTNQKKRDKLLAGGSFDVHLPGEGDGDDSGDDQAPAGLDDLPTLLDEEDFKKLVPDPTGKEGPIPLSPEDKDNIKDDWKSATRNAANATKAGDVPGSIRRMLETLSNPVMDWKDLLNAQFRALVKNDFTWTKASRKSWGGDFYLPGMLYEEQIDIAICIDTSGSITNEMLTDFVSEVKGIMEQFTSFMLRLWFFDEKTYMSYTFTEGNVEELLDVKIEGGGGTEFMCNWDLMKKEGITPKQLVMFTDGYPNGSWGDPFYCDTLFVIHGSKTIKAPFGISAYYDKFAIKQVA